MNDKKVYLDIRESKYFFEYLDLKFYFSSEFLLDKFCREYEEYLKDEILKIKLKYQYEVECEQFLLLSLYKKVEKRGFYVFYKENEITENTQFKIEIV